MYFDRPVEGQGLVWPDVVEHLPVRVGLVGQVLQCLDLHAIEVLVFQ